MRQVQRKNRNHRKQERNTKNQSRQQRNQYERKKAIVRTRLKRIRVEKNRTKQRREGNDLKLEQVAYYEEDWEIPEVTLQELYEMWCDADSLCGSYNGDYL
jgi:uncharacterized protein involved in exopolysaccharide biosynthesis